MARLVNSLLTLPIEFRVAAVFLIGLVLGGVLNYFIYTLAWNRRTCSPWSTAPAGTAARSWRDRVPVLGWLRMQRETSLHGCWFWLRPMLIELATAFGLAALYYWEVSHLGLLPVTQGVALIPAWNALQPITSSWLHAAFLQHSLLIALMIVATFLDIDEKTIPDEVTIPGTLLGLLLAAFAPAALLPGVVFELSDAASGLHVEVAHIASPAPWPIALEAQPPHFGSLAIGLGCFAAWCFALLPRFWHGRYGWRRAARYFVARLVRDAWTWRIACGGLVGSLGITLVWWLSPVGWISLLSSLVGLATAGGVIWIIRLIGRAVLGREAMGFGDVTLMAMIGAFVGWQAGLIVFFFAPLAGLVVGIAGLVLKREDVIPYGPFLCLATVVTVADWSRIWGSLAPIFHQFGSWIPFVLAACFVLMAILLALLQGIKAIVRRAFAK